MNFKKSLIIFSFSTLLISASIVTKACLNEVGTNRKGQQIELDQFYSIEAWKQGLKIPRQERAWFLDSVRDNISAIQKKNSVENMNNLGVSLIYLGEYQTAIKLFKTIEKISPDNYETASNIGTAYELIGDNEQALKWINEGVNRNGNSHYGSEWLHARILEAKIVNKSGVTNPLGGSILQLNFGKNILPVIPKQLPLDNTGKMMDISELANSITYQLTERVNFVRSKDQIVAGLFFDLGNLEFAAGSIEKAEVAYEFALRYGYPDDEKVIKLRRNEIARILASTKGKKLPEGKCETCEPPPPSPAKRKMS